MVSYNPNAFNYYGKSGSQVVNDLTQANTNFQILAEAFKNSDPTTGVVNNALYANQSGTATYSISSQNAQFSLSAQNTTYANQAVISASSLSAQYSQTAGYSLSSQMAGYSLTALVALNAQGGGGSGGSGVSLVNPFNAPAGLVQMAYPLPESVYEPAYAYSVSTGTIYIATPSLTTAYSINSAPLNSVIQSDLNIRLRVGDSNTPFTFVGYSRTASSTHFAIPIVGSVYSTNMSSLTQPLYILPQASVWGVDDYVILPYFAVYEGVFSSLYLYSLATNNELPVRIYTPSGTYVTFPFNPPWAIQGSLRVTVFSSTYAIVLTGYITQSSYTEAPVPVVVTWETPTTEDIPVMFITGDFVYRLF